MKENTTMKEEKDYRYDYRELDRFLSEEHGPELLGEQLDELMGDLVYVCRNEADFGGELSDHYCLLRNLRDLFRKMHGLTGLSRGQV